MWRSLQPFFERSDKLWIGHAISGTIWAFPLIETIHILALTVMYGAMSLIDLRLVGIGMRRQPVGLLTKELEPYMTWGLIVMLVSGFLLFFVRGDEEFWKRRIQVEDGNSGSSRPVSVHPVSKGVASGRCNAVEAAWLGGIAHLDRVMAGCRCWRTSDWICLERRFHKCL